MEFAACANGVGVAVFEHGCGIRSTAVIERAFVLSRPGTGPSRLARLGIKALQHLAVVLPVQKHQSVAQSDGPGVARTHCDVPLLDRPGLRPFESEPRFGRRSVERWSQERRPALAEPTRHHRPPVGNRRPPWQATDLFRHGKFRLNAEIRHARGAREKPRRRTETNGRDHDQKQSHGLLVAPPP